MSPVRSNRHPGSPHNARLSRFASLLISLLVITIAWPSLVAGQTPTPTSLAIVASGDKDNPGWDQQTVDGLAAIASEVGGDATVKDKISTDDLTKTLTTLQNDGAQFVVCNDPSWVSTCTSFAQDSQIPVVIIDDGNSVRPNLISSIAIEPEEAAYLAGVLAGHTTKSGTVGLVVTDDGNDWYNEMTVGFAEGLKASNGSAKLIYTAIDPGTDNLDDATKDAAKAQLDGGADIVFGIGGSETDGIISAIHDFNKKHKDSPAWYIDTIGNRQGDDADVLLTSVLFDFAPTYRQMISDLGTRTFGKTYTMNLDNDSVRLRDLPDAVPDATRQAVAEVQNKLIANQIAVDSVPDADGVRSKLDELGYR